MIVESPSGFRLESLVLMIYSTCVQDSAWDAIYNPPTAYVVTVSNKIHVRPGVNTSFLLLCQAVQGALQNGLELMLISLISECWRYHMILGCRNLQHRLEMSGCMPSALTFLLVPKTCYLH